MAIENGNWISVSYTGTLKDGAVFDTSNGKEPITFEVGSGTVIKGFDTAVIGMNINEEKEFKIPSKDAYGEESDDHQEEVPKEFFQGAEDVKIGMTFMAQSAFGPLKIKVLTFDGEKAKVSVNHPLAGEELTFKIKVEKILNDEEAIIFQEEMAIKHEEMMKAQQEMMEKMKSNQGCSSEGCSSCSGCGDSLEDTLNDEDSETKEEEESSEDKE